jgi:hypothetical protein
MPKFIVQRKATVWCEVQVEAEDQDQALEVADWGDSTEAKDSWEWDEFEDQVVIEVTSD